MHSRVWVYIALMKDVQLAEPAEPEGGRAHRKDKNSNDRVMWCWGQETAGRERQKAAFSPAPSDDSMRIIHDFIGNESGWGLVYFKAVLSLSGRHKRDKNWRHDLIGMPTFHLLIISRSRRQEEWKEPPLTHLFNRSGSYRDRQQIQRAPLCL